MKRSCNTCKLLLVIMLFIITNVHQILSQQVEKEEAYSILANQKILVELLDKSILVGDLSKNNTDDIVIIDEKGYVVKIGKKQIYSIKKYMNQKVDKTVIETKSNDTTAFVPRFGFDIDLGYFYTHKIGELKIESGGFGYEFTLKYLFYEDFATLFKVGNATLSDLDMGHILAHIGIEANSSLGYLSGTIGPTVLTFDDESGSINDAKLYFGANLKYRLTLFNLSKGVKRSIYLTLKSDYVFAESLMQSVAIGLGIAF